MQFFLVQLRLADRFYPPGMLSASRILNDPELSVLSDRMYKRGIAEFIRQDGYVVYRDGEKELTQPSSDELHNLAYIPKTYGGLLPFTAISTRATQLETPFGYMCTPREIADELLDAYHADKVWTQDNGLILYGASKFGLTREAAVAASILPHIGQGQEYFSVEADGCGRLKPLGEGNDRQLWAVAAKHSIEHQVLINNPWL